MAFRIFQNGLEFNFDLDSVMGDITELAIEEIAISKAIELYANTFSKCEIQWTNVKGERALEPEYMLNVRPNLNENATTFWYNVITKMLKEGSVLVFQGTNKELFLADSFDRKVNLYFDDVFTNVVSRGVAISKTFSMSEVIFVEANKEYTTLINSHYKKVGKIVDHVISDYKQSNGKKYAFTLPASFNRVGIGNTANEEEIKNKAQDYVEKVFKKLFDSFNVVIPFQAGEKLEEISKTTGKSIAEIDQAIEMTFKTVAIGFGIPIDIFFGKTTEKSKALDEWLTLELGTMFEKVTDELNAKLVARKDYLKDERIRIDTTRIKHRDILDCANDIDKLHANGITLNEIFKFMGLPADKKDPNADKRFFTKNQEKSGADNL